MTTPTTAEQIDAMLKSYGISPVGIFGETPELRGMAEAVLTARATIARLEGELGESNRLLGEALLRADRLQGDANARAGWLREAKQQRGFDDNVSFDVVWKDVCTRADAAERRVDDMTPLARLGEWALERIRGVYAGDVDAFDVQEKATTFGVIAPQTAPKPCGECCVCEEMDADVCYRDTDATTRARAALAAASGDTATTPAVCSECHGDGYITVPVCCSRGYGNKCCEYPEDSQEPCPKCSTAATEGGR